MFKHGINKKTIQNRKFYGSFDTKEMGKRENNS